MERIALEEAVLKIEEHTRMADGTEMVSLWQAQGRILARALTARADQPPFPRSAMDGYAVRAVDIKDASPSEPAVLRVAGEVTAGQVLHKTVSEGTAVRIMTGAPVPEGADCIVKQEDTDYGETTVCVYRAGAPGQFYCNQGEDYRAGDCLAGSGEKLSAPEIGLAASMGLTGLCVRRKPVTALFTTGDELTEPGQELAEGKIYNGNKYMLYAWLAALGFSPVLAECLPDDEELAAKRIRKAAETADCIITTGGVSVGKKDIMHGVLTSLEAEQIFRGVSVKPGGPVCFSVCRGVPVLSLSGNPSGAMVHLELLGRPLLAALSGDSGLKPEQIWAEMESGYTKASRIRRMVYGRYHDGKVRPAEGPGLSGTISSMRGYNCLIDVEAGSTGICPGERVRVFLL